MTNGTKQSGWDGPLQMDWDFQLSPLRDLLATFAPIATGALRGDLRRPSTTTTNQDKTEITIEIKPPNLSWQYARIQDEGGTTPAHEIKPRFKKALFWKGASHPVAKVNHPGSVIPATNYVDKAVVAWLAHFGSIVFKWRAGKAGQGLQRGSGSTIVSAR